MARPEEHAAEQIDRILDGALRSVATRGYAASSLARIADEAGVSKRMLLYWFSSKDELIRRVAERIVQRLLAVALEPGGAGNDPVDAALAGMRAVWQLLVADPDLVSAYLAVMGEARSTPELAAILAEVRAGHDEVFRRRVEALQANGRKLAMPPEVLSLSAFAGTRGLLLELVESGPSPTLEAAFGLFLEQTRATLSA